VKSKLIFLSIFVLFLLSACSKEQSSMSNNMEHTKKKASVATAETKKTETLTGNEFTIVAKEATHLLTDKVKVDAWTFNGSVPGSEIRVKEGTTVKITLKNELPDPVSIHWHGITVPNEMDGIPGVTQDAVQPGKSFIYEFTPSKSGTYIYHTHQDGVKQLDKGLYGAFIVEAKEKSYDKDYTLVLDEWMSKPEEANMSGMGGMDQSSMNGMEGMDHSNMDSNEASSDSKNNNSDSTNSMMGHNMNAYDIYTINGKSGKSIKPINVKKGERIRLRMINIGFLPHKIHLHGHSFKVVATDGIDLNEPKEIKDELISISPGERYDIEFTANQSGKWYLESHDDSKAAQGMSTFIQYDGSNEMKDASDTNKKLPEFDFANYGKSAKGPFTLNQKYDVEYTMDLNTAMNQNNMVFTINGKAFPNTDNIEVKEGDSVKVKLVNNSPMDLHPMHLHGHSFQVLSKNGMPLKGSPVFKDTINLKPGEEYVVAFKANNPGNWLFHCHDLHHASAGMIDMVKYKDFQSTYHPVVNAKNKPE
jgi:FtsP/CotA-like multicopper oxidase with cupredoxin domain